MIGKKNRFILVVALLIGLICLSSLAYANKEPKPIVSIIMEAAYNSGTLGGLITEDEEEISKLQEILKRAERRGYKGVQPSPAGSWMIKIHFQYGPQIDRYTIVSDKHGSKFENYNTKKSVIKSIYLSDNEFDYILSLTDKENLSQQEKFAGKNYMYIEGKYSYGYGDVNDNVVFVIDDDAIEKIDTETSEILQNREGKPQVDSGNVGKNLASVNLCYWKGNELITRRFRNYSNKIFATADDLDLDDLLYDISLEEFNSIYSLCFPDKS